jgi:hypothetical protein
MNIRPESSRCSSGMWNNFRATFEGELSKIIDLVRSGGACAAAEAPNRGGADDCCFYFLRKGKGEGDFIAESMGMWVLEIEFSLAFYSG